MSIFKDSFHQSIKDQLSKRQEVINSRTPQNLSYLNSRNAWIRMSSAVNVYKKGAPIPATSASLSNPANYDNTLAKQYVLQGGILNYSYNAKDNTFSYSTRTGVGNDFSNAYSNVGSDGSAYRLGIRPMPGITNVDIKSKGAYGSLREATVNFQCWDIKQLEDLELLYMRPGYTVLLEWGWSPYIDNKGTYTTTVDYTDIIHLKWDKEDLFKSQYARATDGIYYKEDGTKVTVTGYQGNADSMFGYVKNYSWKARMDGGYDCSVSIISIGEVIESLKVNYATSDNSSINKTGLLTSNLIYGSGKKFDVSSMTNLSDSYAQNILAGLFYELHEIARQLAGGGNAFGSSDDKGTSWVIYDSVYKKYYDIFRRTINIKGGENEADSDVSIGKSDEQIYITLETLTHILNDYVLLQDKQNKKPFASISVLERPTAPPITPNPISGSGYLLALAHPLQISTDPTVCLIKSPLWVNGINIQLETGSIDPNTGSPAGQYTTTDFTDVFNKIITEGQANTAASADETKIIALVYNATQKKTEEFRTLQKQFLDIKSNPTKYPNVSKEFKEYAKDFKSFLDLLDDSLEEPEITKALVGVEFLNNGGKGGVDPLLSLYNDNRGAITLAGNEAFQAQIQRQQESLTQSAKGGAEGSKFLSKLVRPYFINDNYTTELGIIGNIYVNINMLYNLSVDKSLASQDKKGKKEISLYDFVKNVLSRISTAIGELNNFDIHVDPNGSVARIIDVNYVDRMSAKDAYNNAFELQIHNLNSIVRSYSLESKIFPEQSTIVAIGAQVGGGALGTDTTTLVDFNRSILDRIIPIKDAPTSPPPDEDPNKQLSTLVDSLSVLYGYFGELKAGWWTDGEYNVNESGKYQGALRDLINFFRALGKSKTKNKAIIPTTLSIEMDGIGGIIIGNIFRINTDILPKGYKNIDGVGAKLGYIVTGLGHSLNNNDWSTKIDAQTIMLDEPEGLDINFANLKLSPGSGGNPPIIKVQVGKKGAASKISVIPGIDKMTTFREVTFQVIDNLEGGYFHPNMLKDGRLNDKTGYMSGINPVTGKKIPGISPSGETMFGIDRVNGLDLRKSASTSWDQFWKLIADNNGPNKWSWLYIPPDPLKSQLIELTIKIMEPKFNTFLNRYVPENEIQNVIKSDGRLYFNFVYAVWNGEGWFKGYANETRTAYKNGTKDPAQLATLFVRRRSNNIGVIGNKSNNVLIAQTAGKISQLVGLA